MAQRLGRDSNGMVPMARRGISTRSQNQSIFDQNQEPHSNKLFKGLAASVVQNTNIIGNTNNKRKADASPGKQKQTKFKRSALGNLTNAVVLQNDDRHTTNLKKSIAGGRPTRTTLKSITENGAQELCKTDSTDSKSSYTSAEGDLDGNDVNLICPPPMIKPRATKILTRAAARNTKPIIDSTLPKIVQKQSESDKVGTIVKPRDSLEIHQKTQTRRISNEFEKTDDSLYVSALEDMSTSQFDIKSKPNSPADIVSAAIVISTKTLHSVPENCVEMVEHEIEDESKKVAVEKTIDYKCPEGVTDFDKENWDDPFQVSHYTMDIFNYLKEREVLFQIKDYMAGQQSISRWMRSLLIDWMVEVQESFELNHETLYLAVKIVDLYLSKELISKDSLQLLGAAALFISSKFDERIPPLIDDFLYICDGAYKRKELIQMEMNVFRKIDFDLGIPLSYRFLRRYARCAKVSMPILTLARYILEYSLMDYTTIMYSDSKMAAAALFMALRMNHLDGWNSTLSYYSGLNVEDFGEIVCTLNTGLHRKPKEALKTIRNKYSHKVFLGVAKTPLRKTEELFAMDSN